MKKEYIKPELELIDFIITDEITSDEDMGGIPGDGSLPDGWD